MASSKRPEPPPAPQPVDVVHVSPAVIKWVVGFIGAVFIALTGYWAVADHIDNHWLTTEKANHKFERVDRTSAWILYSIQDFKASAADKWSQDCQRDPRSKNDPNACKQLEKQAEKFAQEAADLKRDANKASKGKDIE